MHLVPAKKQKHFNVFLNHGINSEYFYMKPKLNFKSDNSLKAIFHVS